MPERFALALQHVLPKRALTQLAGYLADRRGGRLTTALIRGFIKRYQVDMGEAANPDPASYATFNDFFTRALRADARPLAEADFICPVDGAISQVGPIERDQIFQAKDHFYPTAALLGGDRSLAAQFEDGEFATIYLSPRDYHRIHMPCAGELRQMVYVPGSLYSVNPLTARNLPGLFARNERVVCVFEGEAGPFVLVLVGATVVGSIATVWHGVVNPPRRPDIEKRLYAPGEVVLRQGEEMGRFRLGSTVVLLFPEGKIRFPSGWTPSSSVRLGELMGERPPLS